LISDMHDCKWQPGILYCPEDMVEYNGHRYKNVQGHKSQSDWTPDSTPALWDRMNDDNSCHQQPQYQEHAQQPQYSEQTPHYSDEKKTEQAPEPHKHWYGDESNKKKLEIGAGVLGGAALLAGGVFAYKKHEEHKEEGKSKVWAHGKWLEEARGRTEALQRHGRSEPAVWVLTHGKSIPNGAIVTGQEHGRNLYTGRAFYEGALVVGKASEHFHKGCVIGYGDKEIEVEEFEVLVGDMKALRWVSARGRLEVESLRCRPVEGGNEKDGTPIYVVHAPYKEAEHPGKTSEKLDGAYITYGGDEQVVKEYQVLCYN